jgi:IclR family transcriptional regulator, pca regulon regulatory protein
MAEEDLQSMESQAGGNGTFVRSVARALKVISGFGAEAPAQTVAQVATRNDLDRATARRALLTLEELGYVKREGRQFSLTPRVLELGFAYISSLPFWSVADDILKDLADSLQSFCLIAATDKAYEQLWIVSSVRPTTRTLLAEFPSTGQHTRTHAVAPGMVLLGGLTGQDLNRALLASTAGDDSVSIPALRERVLRDRRQGWSSRIVPEENFSEIAVPLTDNQGRIIAGLSVLSPLSTISAEDAIEQYLPTIQQAAEDINRLVGYKTPAR